MNKKNNEQFKNVPKFKNNDQERAFWAKHDSSKYVDWSKAICNQPLAKLKPSTETISLRLPLFTLERIKEMSNQKDIPYQSYIKVILDEKIKKEAII